MIKVFFVLSEVYKFLLLYFEYLKYYAEVYDTYVF